MRTTLDLPEGLLREAQRTLGVKSKTDAVVLSLTEVIRRQRIEELKALRGKIDLYIDVAASRRRPGRPARAARNRRSLKAH
jgi:Arc/MetJ family transcription regulator